MTDLVFHVLVWPTFAIALGVFGFAPGAVLRLIVLCFSRDDPRRRELLAELYAVRRIDRPFWVAEQLEVALFEGLRGRFVAWRIKRTQVVSGDNFPTTTWQTSSFAAALGIGGAEVASLDGQILIRNTRAPDGQVITYSRAEWEAFLSAVRNGEFDSV